MGVQARMCIANIAPGHSFDKAAQRRTTKSMAIGVCGVE